MTRSFSHGASTRRPVYRGKQRVRGLTVRTLSDGSLVYEGRVGVNREDKRVPLKARTQTDAIRELEALRTDLDRGDRRLYRRDETVTLSTLAGEYLDHLEALVAQGRFSPRTLTVYRDNLRRHVLPRLGDRAAAELTTNDLRDLVAELARSGLAPNTVHGILTPLRSLLRFGVKRGVLERNVSRDLDRDDKPTPKRKTEPRYLTAAQLEQVFAEMRDPFRRVAMVCAYAGLRVSETLGLRWQDLDLKAGTLTVNGQLDPDGWKPRTKTDASQATLALSPLLVRELRAHRSEAASRNLGLVKPDALVFVTSRGKPQSRRNALRAVTNAAAKAGLQPKGAQPVGLHDLRHSLVGLALADPDVSIVETAALARHANPKVTLAVYAGLAEGGVEQAIAKLAEKGIGA